VHKALGQTEEEKEGKKEINKEKKVKITEEFEF
jgi:hypothetical protein